VYIQYIFASFAWTNIMIVDGYSHVLPLDRLCELAGEYGPPELFGQCPALHGQDFPSRPEAGAEVLRQHHDTLIDPA